MEKWLNENDSLKRMVLTGLTGAVTSIGAERGWPVELIQMFIGFMGTVILGSNIHAAAKAKGEAAAAKVTDASAAAATLGGKVVP